MLRDQVFNSPILVLVGPELFAANNPMGISLTNIARVHRACESGIYSLVYLAYRESPAFGKQSPFVDRLNALGVSIRESHFFDYPLNPGGEGIIREAVNLCDAVFETEILFSVPSLSKKNKQTPDQFLKSLLYFSETMEPFDWNKFRNL
jgi:hypothetical protein